VSTLDAPTRVLFDLDGTLVDSSPGIFHSFRATLNDLGLTASPEQLRNLIGPPLWHSFALLGVADDALDDAVQRYRAYYEHEGVLAATLYPDMATVLHTLRERGVHLAVATAKRVDFAVTMLTHLGVADLFDRIAGADVGLRQSDKYEIMTDAMAAWPAIDPATCWMVGDRRYDVEGARRHGVQAVGVTWGFGDTAELIDAGATAIVGEPHELLGSPTIIAH